MRMNRIKELSLGLIIISLIYIVLFNTVIAHDDIVIGVIGNVVSVALFLYSLWRFFGGQHKLIKYNTSSVENLEPDRALDTVEDLVFVEDLFEVLETEIHCIRVYIEDSNSGFNDIRKAIKKYYEVESWNRTFEGDVDEMESQIILEQLIQNLEIIVSKLNYGDKE